MARKPLTPEVVNRLRVLLQQGNTLEEISNQLKISFTTIIKYRRKLRIDAPKRGRPRKQVKLKASATVRLPERYQRVFCEVGFNWRWNKEKQCFDVWDDEIKGTVYWSGQWISRCKDIQEMIDSANEDAKILLSEDEPDVIPEPPIEKPQSRRKPNRETFCFVSPEGEIVKVKFRELTEFARQNNLTRSVLGLLTKGKRQSHKQWRLAQ